MRHLMLTGKDRVYTRRAMQARSLLCPLQGSNHCNCILFLNPLS